MSTNLRDKSDQEWHAVDILQRLQCLSASPGHAVRYGSRANKALKDARKEIATLRNSNVALKEAYNKIYMLQLKNSRLRDKIRNCASNAKLMLDVLDEKG